MLIPRVIPCLLLRNGTLVKTIRFQNASYVGDPTNAIRIYNEKEVDEIIVLDITATMEGKAPSMDVIETFANECFMPLAYGGGIREQQQIKDILRLGVEKVVLNTIAYEKPDFVRAAADSAGSQAIVVSIDAKRKTDGGYQVFARGGREATGRDPLAYAEEMQRAGAGEIFLNSIDQDGTMEGYDLPLVKRVAAAVDIPVIACGGAGKVADFGLAVKEAGASAVAAGSMVVYFGRNRAVLVSFPRRKELEKVLL